MRTFIALELPEEFRSEVAGVARLLRDAVKGRYVAPENYHLTLAFLGDISQQDVDRAIDALEVACAEMGPIRLASDGLGKFGKSRDATLWLGLQRSDELAGLAKAVREELTERGIAFDGKPFKAHITLARRASIPQGQLPAVPFPNPADACTVTLFKSELSSEGATYHPLHSVSLAHDRSRH